MSTQSGSEHSLIHQTIDQPAYRTAGMQPSSEIVHHDAPAVIHRSEADKTSPASEGQKSDTRSGAFASTPRTSSANVLMPSPAPSPRLSAFTPASRNWRPKSAEMIDRVQPLAGSNALQRRSSGIAPGGNRPGLAGNPTLDRFIFRQVDENLPNSSAAVPSEASVSTSGSVPVPPLPSGSSSSGAKTMSDVEVRSIADKVYRILVRRLASEKGRRG